MIQALRNNSAPGPDGVRWKLLKMISDTELGKAILQGIVQVVEREGDTRMLEE